MAVRIDRHCANGSVLHLRIEPALREKLIELAAAFRSHEPAVLDLLEPGLAGQAVRAVIGEENVGPALHQGARER